MNDTEKILYLRDKEKLVQVAEVQMNHAKDVHATAKKRFDSAVEELRSAIRRDSDQMELDMKAQDAMVVHDAEVIGESHQLTEGAPRLPENPGTEHKPRNKGKRGKKHAS
jgi:hypothetical protein